MVPDPKSADKQCVKLGMDPLAVRPVNTGSACRRASYSDGTVFRVQTKDLVISMVYISMVQTHDNRRLHWWSCSTQRKVVEHIGHYIVTSASPSHQ